MTTAEAIKAIYELEAAIEAGVEASRQRAIALTKLDEARLWLADLMAGGTRK